MAQRLVADVNACKTCSIGTCCYEGVEVTTEELKRIVKFTPAVPKPWFRTLEGTEKSDEEHPFATVVRAGTCVFQDKDNRCMVYEVRPDYCRDFPLEHGKTAPHYRRLCVLFHQEWLIKSIMKKNLLTREGKKLNERFQQIEKTVDFPKSL